MGVLDAFRGRKSTSRTIVEEPQNEKSVAAEADGHSPSSHDPETPPASLDGSHQGDMFDDVKELAHNPDSVTSGAELGQQKAEAAALVWSRSALVGIYAW